MSGLRRLAGRLRNRRGATLVLIAIMLTVMIGMVGVSVDFARMYAFKAQLQVTADAGAMAGAIELVKGRNNAFVPDSVIKYADPNRVNGNIVATVANADVEPLSWNFDTKVATASTWGAASTNAVRVTAHYAAPYTFGKIFGATNSALAEQAIAALGYASASNCLKPWAIGYQQLLDKLYPAGTKPVTYNLTTDDINTLKGMSSPANEVSLLMGNQNTTAPGNIAQVVTYSSDYQKLLPPGGSPYAGALKSDLCPDLLIGPGTWLDADPGAGSGQTQNPLKDYCTAHGGVTSNGNDYTCNTQPKIKMAVWDITNTLSGGNVQYRVKYVAVFAIVGFVKLAGDEQVKGYFSSMADPNGGTFSSTPSPLTGKAILVQ